MDHTRPLIIKITFIFSFLYVTDFELYYYINTFWYAEHSVPLGIGPICLYISLGPEPIIIIIREYIRESMT